MYRCSNIKSLVLILLVVAIVGMSVAYALLSTTLTITGNTSLSAASWDIYFSNLSASTYGSPTYILPTVSDTTLSDFEIVLTQPGDDVQFSFDIVNNGTIDAKITSLIKGSPVCNGVAGSTTGATDGPLVCNNLAYYFYYSTSGDDVKEGDVLKAGESKKVTLQLSYIQSATELPVNDVAISNLDITLVYGHV